MTQTPFILNASAVEIGGRALAVEGLPGCGKSSLALALIDRGARLIGDDGVTLTREGDQIIASPPPNIAGLLELRGVGLFECKTAPPCPLSLILMLGGPAVERLPETLPSRDILGVDIPSLFFDPGTIAPAIRAEWALSKWGI